MSAALSTTVVITPHGDEISSRSVQEGKYHRLLAECDTRNRDMYLNFSTRRAMYDFAVSLLHESVYGTSGQQEFYPLICNGDAVVVNGVRMSEDSSRLFVFYESESARGNES